LFKNNKYTLWYFRIIDNAKLQGRSKGGGTYYESHHVIPKSMGGSDATDNRVLLTAREHFICHALLVKMVECERAYCSMVFALNGMKRSANQRYMNAKLYEVNRKRLAKVMSERVIPPHFSKLMSDRAKQYYRTYGSPTLGREHTEQEKQRMRDNHYDCRGANNPRAVSCKINDVIYPTKQDAMAALNASWYILTSRLNSKKWPTWEVSQK
jgi:hypothetical protein